MPHDSNSSAPASAKTSAKPAAQLSESEYLARQAADAKAAIRNTLSDLQHELVKTVDPRAWMQIHPWATLGAAAIAGFAAATLAIPSEEDQALHRLAKLEAALGNGHEKQPTPSPSGSQSTLLTKLGGMALQAAQPVLSSLIVGLTAGAGAATGAAAQDNQSGSENNQGRAPTSDPSI